MLTLHQKLLEWAGLTARNRWLLTFCWLFCWFFADCLRNCWVFADLSFADLLLAFCWLVADLLLTCCWLFADFLLAFADFFWRLVDRYMDPNLFLEFDPFGRGRNAFSHLANKKWSWMLDAVVSIAAIEALISANNCHLCGRFASNKQQATMNCRGSTTNSFLLCLCKIELYRIIQ